MKKNREEDTKIYLTLTVNLYKKELKTASELVQEKHKNLLYAATDENSELT